MQTDPQLWRKIINSDLIDLSIRLGLIVFLVYMCIKILSPFMSLIVWGLVLAVAIYPLHKHIAGRMGDRQGAAATAFVLGALLLIGVPIVMLAGSFVDHVQSASDAFQGKQLAIKPPSAKVASLPLAGEKLYDLWNLAATDLPGLLDKLRPQLASLSKSALGAVASTAGGILQFFASLIIAGIMLAYSASGSAAMARIVNRMVGPERGATLYKLSVATIRSVAVGVIGIAVIQALLLGIGFIVAGIPAAGVLALIVLLVGIAQLPALLLTIPVIAYIWWSGDSATMNTVYTVYLLLAGSVDNFLKPVLLGRGVDAPMPIILLGALGGMVTGGIIGLFLGAVTLALGYVLFMEWVAREVDDHKATPVAEAASTETASPKP
jgi:predicted PurR-regulated permease PerM